MKTDLQFKEDSKLIHEYLKAIKKKLRPHTKAEKKYLTELKNAMYDYAESSGDKPITMEGLSMKQKLITLGLIVAMLISVIYVAPVQAAEADDDSEIITCKVIIYEYPTEPTEISAARATSTKSASKTVVFQNANGDVLWQVTLDATFRYNGSTSVCTAANASTQTFSSSWKTRVSSCSKSQNRAYASAYGNRYSVKGKLLETVTQNVTLTCSKTGAIS